MSSYTSGEAQPLLQPLLQHKIDMNNTADKARWDFVMIFPAPENEPIAQDMSKQSESGSFKQHESFAEIVLRLHSAGLETKLFSSVSADAKNNERVTFCKIRASNERLKIEAERMKLRVLLNADELRAAAIEGVDGGSPFPIPDRRDIIGYGPYEHIYAPYMRNEELQKFFVNKKLPAGEVFDSTTRLMIIHNIITCRNHGARCDLEKLMCDGHIVDCFPLHEERPRQRLKENWLVWGTSALSQPFDEIRDYFGVKVALYFLYLGHYTRWLAYAAVIGLIPGVLNFAFRGAEKREIFPFLSPIFGAFMTIWATTYLEQWKRWTARASFEWGTFDYQEEEHVRPEFKEDVKMVSPYDGTKGYLYQDPTKKLKRLAISWCVILFLICIVFGLVLGIFVLRYDLTKGPNSMHFVILGHPVGPMVAAFANVVQITIMTKIYNIVSIKLNDQENHRTQTEYENHFIIKTVIFQFVNNYAGLFYVAFIKSDLEGCDGSCMHELEYLLAFVYCSRLIVGNFTEVLIPRFWAVYGRYQLFGFAGLFREEEDQPTRSRAEEDLFLADYGWRGTFDDYTEMVLQFGFTTMFVVSFPFAPLLSLINNYFEIRLDAFRLLKETRRPRPQNVCNMGYWYQVLQAMSAISVCTNGGVIIFTGDYFNTSQPQIRVWYFTIFVSVMFFFKYVLEVCIDDVPADVRAQLKRQDVLISKCLYRVQDDDNKDEAVKKRRSLNAEYIKQLLHVAAHE
ncbi:TPA: hypothetical protein N0F65_009357 [Lagenidium giganteum]|uniref:Anoctamin n=1 Tax=Lagenidium giganteum TaxID=4803 RepID=A0AAV2ZIY3_9STRA|nr:TPA: hypothetical protein N0F65_009357 [Lagenidium giganteum]